MAKTIPQLTDATTVNAADELIVHQGGITKRATGGELAQGLVKEFNTLNNVANVTDYGALGDPTAEADAIAAAKTDKSYLLNNTSSYVLTVGSGGDFATINEAIAQAERMRPLNKPNLDRVEIKLLAGFVMREQVIVRGKDLAWITITGEDASTVVDKDFMTINAIVDPLQGVESFSPFHYEACAGPVIGQLFNMNDAKTGGLGKHGLFCNAGATALLLPGAGFINASNVGAYARSGSKIAARACFFTNCRIGVFCFHGSSVDISESDCSDCDWYGLYVNRASHASFHEGKATGCGRDNLRVVRASCVNAELANLSGATGARGEFGAGIYAQSSTVHALGVNASGCMGPAVYSRQGSTVQFSVGNADNCGDGNMDFASVRAFEVSHIDAHNTLARNANQKTSAVLSERGSTINFNGGNASGSVSTYGVVTASLGRINAANSNARKTEGVDGSGDFRVVGGGQISASNALGGVNVTKNTVSAEGIFFQP